VNGWNLLCVYDQIRWNGYRRKKEVRCMISSDCETFDDLHMGCTSRQRTIALYRYIFYDDQSLHSLYTDLISDQSKGRHSFQVHDDGGILPQSL
jgi:hypothetical protein